ncbi:MAG: sulfite exporter TauE/SafE family protein [Rhodothermales bacterium]
MHLREIYGGRRLALYAAAAVLGAIFIAGFWNYHLVDGFGRDVIAAPALGNTSDLAGAYPDRGMGFGFIFAAIAGLAATFTACNCVVFAMLPGLACSVDSNRSTKGPWMALGAFVAGVTIVCGIYGAFIGLLGSGVELLNARSVRLAQARIVFTGLGVAMLVWGMVELGYLDRVTNCFSERVRAFFGSIQTKAAIIGVFVGLFAVGRPFPVFREFLSYAAGANNPLYGASVMMVQGLGQILVMVLLFVVMVALGGRRLMEWSAEAPHKPQLMSGLALLAGGAFFVFYWGLSFAMDIGRWGFKLGWYG